MGLPESRSGGRMTARPETNRLYGVDIFSFAVCCWLPFPDLLASAGTDSKYGKESRALNRLIISVVTIFNILLPVFASDAATISPAHEQRRSVTVRGEGSISIKPDLAVITFGTLSQSALEANNKSMRKLFETIKAFGISNKNVRTSGFNVSPQYERGRAGGRARRIVGYSVRNSATVKLHDLSRMGEFIGKVAGQGANQLHGLRFIVEKTPERMDNLRKTAVRDATRKARILAEAAGLKLGRAIRIAEGSVLTPGPRFGLAMGKASSSVPVAPGESELRLSVTVVFEVE